VNAEEILEQVCRDRDAVGVRQTDPELEALAVAVLVEDVLGIVLDEEDLRADLLTDRARRAALVTRSQGHA
jgi:hypothetical protein